VAEGGQDMPLQILPVSAHGVLVPFERDIGEPALGVVAERDVTIRDFRDLLVENAEDLGRMLVRLLLGGEERAVPASGPVPIVDFPDAPVLAVADLDGGLRHRSGSLRGRGEHGEPRSAEGARYASLLRLQARGSLAQWKTA